MQIFHHMIHFSRIMYAKNDLKYSWQHSLNSGVNVNSFCYKCEVFAVSEFCIFRKLIFIEDFKFQYKFFLKLMNWNLRELKCSSTWTFVHPDQETILEALQNSKTSWVRRKKLLHCLFWVCLEKHIEKKRNNITSGLTLIRYILLYSLLICGGVCFQTIVLTKLKNTFRNIKLRCGYVDIYFGSNIFKK